MEHCFPWLEATNIKNITMNKISPNIMIFQRPNLSPVTPDRIEPTNAPPNVNETTKPP